MKPYSKRHHRFSNYDPYGSLLIIPTNEDGSIYTGQNTSGSGSSSTVGNGSSGSGTFNYSMIGGWLNTIGNVVTGIWGTSSNVQADMLNEQLRQERRTTTILWVIIGLVLALGVVLVIRKTK